MMDRGRLPAIGLHLSAHVDSRRAIELAVASEAAGLGSIWLAEDLFYRGAFARAGAIAVATERIKVALGVLTPYVRHPALAAMELTSLHELLGDRLICGYGAGVRVRTERLGAVHGPPVEVVAEVVATLRRLLAGEQIDAEGSTHPAAGLGLDAPPGTIPIHVAATGPRALEQAGAIADGVILTLMASAAHMRFAVEHVRRGAEGAGRPSPPITAYMAGAIDTDSGAAIDAMRPFVAQYVVRWEAIEALRGLFLESGVVDAAELHRIATDLREGASPREVVPDSLVEAHAVVGTSAQVRRRIEELSELGIDVVAFEPGPQVGAQTALIGALGQLIAERSPSQGASA